MQPEDSSRPPVSHVRVALLSAGGGLPIMFFLQLVAMNESWQASLVTSAVWAVLFGALMVIFYRWYDRRQADRRSRAG